MNNMVYRGLKVKRLKLLILAVLILPVFNFIPVQAQEPEERITLSPAVIRPDFEGGEVATGNLTVINDGVTDYTFLLYARPFSVDGEQYDPNYTEVNERTEAYQWVQFNESEVRLAAGESVEVGYTIRVPQGAASGGHYAVLFAETQPPAGSANVARKKRVGALLYMSVDGEINRAGSLQSWDTDFWQRKRPVVSTIRLKNEGNVHFQADLNATYTNIFGKKQFELNQELLILPGTTRRIPIVWEDAPYLGIFKSQATITYLDKTEELPSKYVLLLPLQAIFIFAGIVSAGVILLLLRTRILKRKKNKNAFKKRH